MELKEQTRRRFCRNTCRVASVAALGGVVATVLESCGGGTGGSATGPSNVSSIPVVNGTAGTSSITVTIDGSSPLASVGSAALVRSSIGDVLVAHTGQDAYAAFTSICTHQACEITGLAGQLFVCPCHGSEYDFAGRVVLGPAPSALRQYTAQLSGNQLTITG
jgi:Rieske Fe-S protein